jgi:C1A family cysteine protease
MNNTPGGWRIDLENWDSLSAMTNESSVLAMRGTYQAVTLDPREAIQIPNQKSQGSCQGHAVTTCMEWCCCIASGRADVQLSRAAGYYLSQELDGIRGDSGSTVDAGCKLATNSGIGEEKYWPYPDRYNPQKPSNFNEYVENAKRYKIRATFKMSTYDGIATFLGSGQGAVEIGIGWNSSCDRSVVESYAAGGGGHALAFIALSERKDSQGRNYVWLANSWGTTWGNKGWSEVSPNAVSQMLNARYTVMIGLSDMPNVKPREYSLQSLKKDLRI